MNVCGLWQGGQRLAAVIADEHGGLRPPITVRATPQNTHHLLDYLVTADIENVGIPEYPGAGAGAGAGAGLPTLASLL